MSKTKMDKKVNKVVRKFNKQLKEDVFKDRFIVRQYQKTRVDDVEYYLYELRDNLEPERNKVIYEWMTGYGIITFGGKIWEEMNDFIIKSDFWDLYWKDKKKEVDN